MEKPIEYQTDSLYFSHIRKELLELIPAQNRNGNMLEIGAAGGHTLMYAKQNGYARKIWGVELCAIDNSFQASAEFENFILGDIEKIALPFSHGQFDVIVCGDVLEHLVHPDAIVSELRKYLKQDGVFVASIPNIRHWSALKTIFWQGDFRYVDAGIMDRTHLRFFCKKNILELFENNGFDITRIESNTFYHHARPKLELFNRLTFGRFEEFLTIQYYTVAQPK